MKTAGKVRVRFLKSIAGAADPENGLRHAFEFQPDESHSLDEPLARKWAASGICEIAEQVPVLRPVASQGGQL